MSMREMDNTNATWAKAWGKDIYENPHIQTVTVDFLRIRGEEPFISRTFVGLNVLDYKRAR